MLRTYLVLLSVAGIALMTGCKTESDFRNERAEKAVRYFEVSKFRDRELRDRKTLTLDECIRIGLKHNLDIKVFHQEEDIASEKRTAEILGMLPEINFNEHFSGRSNTPASSSKSYRGQGVTYGASQNQDRVGNMFNIDFALSIVDFGLAFFNSQQAQDRVILRKQRTDRMKQNLTLDIVRAYCKVAAAQRAVVATYGLVNPGVSIMDIVAAQRAVAATNGLLTACKNRIDLVKRLAKRRQITPYRAFEETRKFNEMQRSLKTFVLEYHNACVELRSLLGYYPSAEIVVDDKFLDKFPKVELPDLVVMEQAALIKRPELSSIEVERHINIVECRKAIISMFPTAKIFLDYNVSSNSFLYNQNWWELGINAAFNLLKLPQKIATFIAYDKQADADLMRVYAQSVAVIAQVRMADADIRASKKIYEKNAVIFQDYKKALDDVRKVRKVSKMNDFSRFEVDHMRLATVQAEIEKDMALANYCISYYRLMNSIGMKSYSVEAFKALPEELKSVMGKSSSAPAAAKAN